ncbi:MAG: hypothetical protein JWN43_127, partial [Gammaproteobacteria bacterium]|nr:hypothetical protein [Gammaproteobacteria bacterium]
MSGDVIEYVRFTYDHFVLPQERIDLGTFRIGDQHLQRRIEYLKL